MVETVLCAAIRQGLKEHDCKMNKLENIIKEKKRDPREARWLVQEQLGINKEMEEQ
jgi:hypothetical protein